jgi:hypothetical protein
MRARARSIKRQTALYPHLIKLVNETFKQGIKTICRVYSECKTKIPAPAGMQAAPYICYAWVPSYQVKRGSLLYIRLYMIGKCTSPTQVVGPERFMPA